MIATHTARPNEIDYEIIRRDVQEFCTSDVEPRYRERCEPELFECLIRTEEDDREDCYDWWITMIKPREWRYAKTEGERNGRSNA